MIGKNWNWDRNCDGKKRTDDKTPNDVVKMTNHPSVSLLLYSKKSWVVALLRSSTCSRNNNRSRKVLVGLSLNQS